MLVALLIILIASYSEAQATKKNVIIIMADDLAYNDVSYRGSNEIPTPNIDALAYNGIILNKFYTPPLCTPSRSALLTAKYPHRLGMQELVIVSDEPWGLPLSEKIMPQYFKEVGYKTHLIGKWHLGFFQQQYTPTRRGFDSFFGYHGPYIDYFSYTHQMFNRNYSRGYDMRRNLDVAGNLSQQYVTNLFTNEAVNVIRNHDKQTPLFLMVNHLAPHAGNEDVPMQAIPEDIELFSYISDIKRRKLAAMIYRLDLSVGEIVKSLKESDLLKNSIIVFYSDNGGPTLGVHSTAASNHPLRGQKESGWEGGIRTNAIIYSPSLPNSVVQDELFYVADLLPTLNTLSNAGFSITADIDGVDQSRMLMFNLPLQFGQRKEVVTVDNVAGYYSYIYNNLKYVNGSSSNGIYDDWIGSNNNTYINLNTYEKRVLNSAVSKALGNPLFFKPFAIKRMRYQATVKCGLITERNRCNLQNGACLFDLRLDPCERNDLSKVLPNAFKEMQILFNNQLQKLVPSRRKNPDSLCDPKNFNSNWNWWQSDS